MTVPSVTIVTVTFNAARTLQAAIDSVLMQDYPAIEYILVDGGSTDGTLEVITRNAARIARWTSEPDGGIYEAMNKGVAQATGEWLLFMNADDALYDARAVSSVFAGADDGWKEKLVVYGDTVLRFDRGGDRLRRSKPLRTLRFKMPFAHQGVFVRTDLLRRRPFDTRYRLAADFDFFRDIYARHGEGVFLARSVRLNYFRIGGASYQNLGLRHREFLDVIRRNERGWARGYYYAHYVVRCLVPERLRDWAARLVRT
jgi:glycosyltransferase involved in cell wall biosynthesis